jgi:hypothetical protein
MSCTGRSTSGASLAGFAPVRVVVVRHLVTVRARWFTWQQAASVGIIANMKAAELLRTRILFSEISFA